MWMRQPSSDLALNVDNVFQADDCDAYDSDVDDAPTAQTLFMANLSSADPVYDEAGTSYDRTLIEYKIMITIKMLFNMTPYDQYVKDNAVPVVQNNASMVLNDAYGMIDNDLHESDVLSVSHTPRNTVVNNLLNAELATYKEQVELYERRARNFILYNAMASTSNITVNEVFYVASNSELNVSRFTEMQKAHHVVKARCLELEAELSNLRDDVRKDNYNDLLKPVFQFEANTLNLQQHHPKLKYEISQLKETRSELDQTIDFRARDFQISQLTEKVNSLQEQNELFRVENAKIKQHYKELYDSIKITRAKHTEQTTALKNENEWSKRSTTDTIHVITTN
ncbi:hypothetical protein Tco_0163282 [Tanacetum coccineum]